jgi:hypothetical protein
VGKWSLVYQLGVVCICASPPPPPAVQPGDAQLLQLALTICHTHNRTTSQQTVPYVLSTTVLIFPTSIALPVQSGLAHQAPQNYPTHTARGEASPKPTVAVSGNVKKG